MHAGKNTNFLHPHNSPKDFYLSQSHQENPNTLKNLITQGNNTREGTMGNCSLSTENM
jgi:hypothetical protein